MVSKVRGLELTPLTIDQRVEIDDDWNIFMAKAGKAEMSYKVALKAIRFACKNVPDDLSNLELVELFNEIFMISHTTDIEKKK